MTSQIIEQIERTMMPHLDEHQQQLLHLTLQQYSEEASDPEDNTGTQNYVKVFLAAKRVEGCSEKTVRYYDSTIRNVLTAIGKDAKDITTDDLRM